jgi:hypothetical protein
MIVLLALGINLVIALFLVQRRSSGLVPRNYLKLLGEATDFDLVLDPLA